METPFSHPARRCSMNSRAGASHQVADMSAPGCHRVANSSQNPESEKMTQLSMTSRIASLSSHRPSPMSAQYRRHDLARPGPARVARKIRPARRRPLHISILTWARKLTGPIAG